MKTIWVDFNAVTNPGELSLTTRGSAEDLREAGLGPGNWTWFSDGEVLVGGQIRDDPYWGLVAVPDWGTLVHLDTDVARDGPRIERKLRFLLDRLSHPYRAVDEDTTLFELLTQLEQLASLEWKNDVEPGFFAAMRCSSLIAMGRLELAAVEILEMMTSKSSDSGSESPRPLPISDEERRSIEATGAISLLLAFAELPPHELMAMIRRSTSRLDAYVQGREQPQPTNISAGPPGSGGPLVPTDLSGGNAPDQTGYKRA